MPFNKDISGFKNEEEFVEYLNGKLVKEVHPIFQELFNTLYKNISSQDKIICWLDFNKRKADMYVKINNIIKGISIKKGIKNSVHVEHIDDFIEFMNKLGVEENIIKEYLKYHYADGTMNGSGEKRLSSIEYRQKNQCSLDYINSKLNINEYIDKFTERFILKGNRSNYEIDAIIYGVVDDFIWITNNEIRYIIKKHLDDNISSLHISCLSIQPLTRNLNYSKKNEYGRNHIQVKWYNIADQIIEVMATYRKMKNIYDMSLIDLENYFLEKNPEISQNLTKN